MTATATADRTFEVLLKLVEKVAEQGSTLNAVLSGMNRLSDNTNAQLTILTERTGRTEALNAVQDEKIIKLEQTIGTQQTTITELSNEITKLRLQMAIAVVLGMLASSILTGLVIRFIGHSLGF